MSRSLEMTVTEFPSYFQETRILAFAYCCMKTYPVLTPWGQKWATSAMEENENTWSKESETNSHRASTPTSFKPTEGWWLTVVSQEAPRGFLAPVSSDKLDGHFPKCLQGHITSSHHWKRSELYPGINANSAQTICDGNMWVRKASCPAIPLTA